MRMMVAASALSVLLGGLAFGGSARCDDAAAKHDLAPSGTLRAAINLGNSVLAAKNAQTGALSGVSVDLARELGRELGVPVTLVPYDSAGAVSGAARSDVWDICFLAIDPKRAEDIAFTKPYVVIEGSYLVPGGSPIHTLDEVDRTGVRISVGRGSAYDLFLTRAIHHATLVRAPTSPAAIKLFVDNKLEVAANVRQPLAAYASAHSDVRLLPGHFMEIKQAMGMRTNRPSGAAFLRDFVDRMKAAGFITKALSANGQDAALAAGG